MATPWATIAASPPAEHRRRGLEYPNGGLYRVKSAEANWSWGSEPAGATLVYVGSASQIVTGMSLELNVAGHTFHGAAESDEQVLSTKGYWRTISFKDNRRWLDWDVAFCAFNVVHDKIDGGRRVRQFKHMLPWDYNSYTWTVTSSALTAAQILNFVFSAQTTEDTWTRIYHPDQSRLDGSGRPYFPILNIDALNGKKLRAIVQEISDAQGLVFTLMGGPFRLVWSRKGEGPDPIIPVTLYNQQGVKIQDGSNNRSLGVSLSGHPTRLRVLGDRNSYQVHDITMVHDWSDAWVDFYDFNLFSEQIFQWGKLTKGYEIKGVQIPAGTCFSDIPLFVPDPEQMISRHLAAAYAREITVREYADLIGDTSFYDTRKFAGRTRMDMGAKSYIEQVLFRAFRFPPGFAIRNVQDKLVPAESLEVAPKMIAQVTHDQTTGLMDWDLTQNPDGNGYAIALGYQVGKDLFKTIRPERFQLSDWDKAQSVWQHIEFQIDDCGEPAGAFILFDEPVILTDGFVKSVDGYGVFVANPTIKVPPVRVALTLNAERFSYIQGYGTRDDVENASGLSGEFVSRQGWLPAEVPFLDGLYASQKASRIATALLNRQFSYLKGSYTCYPLCVDGTWTPVTQLTPKIDRVYVNMDTGGCREVIDLTTERPRDTYIPERDLDRGQRLKELFPGQAQNRQESRALQMIAAGLKQSPALVKTLSNAFYGFFGSEAPLHRVLVVGGNDNPVPVGCPFSSLPPVSVDDGNGGTVIHNTLAVLPSATTVDHKYFQGVTTRHGETTGGHVFLQQSGDMLARVMGPVVFGQAIGLVPGQDYLGPNSVVPCARALQALGAPTDGNAHLIKITTEGQSKGEGGSLIELTVVGEADDYLSCIDPSDGSTVFVAKPKSLRASQWNPGWLQSDGGDSIISHQDFGLHYLSTNRRWRVLTGAWGAGATLQPDLLNGFMKQVGSGDPAAFAATYPVGDYKVSVETVTPPYPYAPPDMGPTAWGRGHLHSIIASKFSDAIGYTSSDDGTQPIYYLDTNVDARTWVAEAIANLHLAMVNGSVVIKHGEDILGHQLADNWSF
jgi:hypothetical protein